MNLYYIQISLKSISLHEICHKLNGIKRIYIAVWRLYLFRYNSALNYYL